MIASAVLTIGLQLLAIYLPGLNSVLHTVPLTGYELLMVFAFGLVPLAVGQAIRWVWLRTR